LGWRGGYSGKGCLESIIVVLTTPLWRFRFKNKYQEVVSLGVELDVSYGAEAGGNFVAAAENGPTYRLAGTYHTPLSCQQRR